MAAIVPRVLLLLMLDLAQGRAPHGMYYICNQIHQRCLHAPYHASSVPVQLDEVRSSYGGVLLFIDGQQSSLIPAHWLKATYPVEECIDVRYRVPANGTTVQTEPCIPGDEGQEWVLPVNNKGQIKWAPDTTFCLDVQEHRFVLGALLQIWECQDGNEGQMWEMFGPAELGPF